MTVPTVGVYVDHVDDDRVVVVELVPGGAAEAAGIGVGQVIASVDGVPVHDALELSDAVRGRPVGSALRMEVDDGSRVMTVDVVSEPRRQFPTSVGRRAFFVGLGAVLTAFGIIALIGLLGWRRGVKESWLALLVLAGFGLPYLVADELGYLGTALFSLGVAFVGVGLAPRIRPRAPMRSTLRTLAGSTLAYPAVAVRGVVLGALMVLTFALPLDRVVVEEAARGASYPIAYVVLLGPALEEGLMRGVLLPLAVRATGPWAGIVLSGVAFGCLHGGATPNVGGPVALGILLGYVYLRTGRLWPCFILHATINSVSLALLGLL